MLPLDDDSNLVRTLYVPEPPEGAQARVMEAVSCHHRRQNTLFAMLRRAKAWLYVPQMRYAVMASIVVLFIALGLTNNAAQPTTSNAAPQLTAEAIPDDLLLYDLEFATFDPADVAPTLEQES